MDVAICRHIKTNGLQCRGVAVTGSTFCYFHRRLQKLHAPYRLNAVGRAYLIPGRNIELLPLEDRESIQIAISQVVNALATGRLDIRNATGLLYGLQVASANARGLRTDVAPEQAARTVHTSTSIETPGVDLACPGRVHELPPDPAEDEDRADEPVPELTLKDYAIASADRFEADVAKHALEDARRLGLDTSDPALPATTAALSIAPR